MTVNLDLGHRASAHSVGVRACIRIHRQDLDSREANDSDLILSLCLSPFLSLPLFLSISSALIKRKSKEKSPEVEC